MGVQISCAQNFNQKAVIARMNKKTKNCVTGAVKYSSTFLITHKYIEKSLLKFYSREYSTVEQVFFVCFDFIADGYLRFVRKPEIIIFQKLDHDLWFAMRQTKKVIKESIKPQASITNQV